MILVTGGTGFVGRHLVARLRADKLPVRVLVRTPDKARALKDLGVEIAVGDISDAASLEAAMKGCEKVSILSASSRKHPGNVPGRARGRHANFLRRRRNQASPLHLPERPRHPGECEEPISPDQVDCRGARTGERHPLYDPQALAHLRPGDLFTVRLSEMIKLSPVLPVIGSGRSRVQPIFIDDVVRCLRKIVTGDSCLNEICEIGGPEQLTYEEVTMMIAEVMGVKRPMVHMPLFFLKPMARVLEAVLSRPPVTTDQLIMLQEDAVCSMRDIHEVFGVEPIGFREGLKRFLGK